MTWNCPKCHEVIEHSFDICWNCGSRRDGTADPHFQHADQYRPRENDERAQISVWRLLQLVTGLSFVVAMLAGSYRNGIENRMIFVLGLIASGIIFMNGFSWLLVWSTQRMQANSDNTERSGGVDQGDAPEKDD